MGTITFQQKHTLWSSSCPPELLICFDTNPSRGATVTWPQTPPKPHRPLNNRSAVLVHLLKVKLSIFLQGRPRAVPKPGGEAELCHFCSAPAVVRQILPPLTARPAAARGPQGRKMKEKQQWVPGDTAWWELPPLVCLRSCWIPVSQGASVWQTIHISTSGSNTSTAW